MRSALVLRFVVVQAWAVWSFAWVVIVNQIWLFLQTFLQVFWTCFLDFMSQLDTCKSAFWKTLTSTALAVALRCMVYDDYDVYSEHLHTCLFVFGQMLYFRRLSVFVQLSHNQHSLEFVLSSWYDRMDRWRGFPRSRHVVCFNKNAFLPQQNIYKLIAMGARIVVHFTIMS